MQSDFGTGHNWTGLSDVAGYSLTDDIGYRPMKALESFQKD